MELQIKTATEDLLAGLQLEEASCTVARKVEQDGEELEHYSVEIKTTDAPLLIGKHGDNLNAFQHLLRMISSKKADELNRKIMVFVDVDGYRRRQDDDAVELACRRAEQVRASGNPVKLQSMSGFMRRLIHLELAKPEWDDVVTESVGSARFRAIVIKKKD
ncbi:KH domain-containing protein [Candidatus Gracilibacteria bacterium]|nr:KH domain-containing protein [Candidatus Gracilibacteria bacterium]MCF7856739.1 KH domain-containing protein [Candidatus Gracilibacteria bacterium]MCF7896947.1 KH domain-containing protein [Candidatus Gracilibacteria bacterium]